MTRIKSALLGIAVGFIVCGMAQLLGAQELSSQSYDSIKVEQFFEALTASSQNNLSKIEIRTRGDENWSSTRRTLWRVGQTFAQHPAVTKKFWCPPFKDSLDLVTYSTVDIDAYFELMRSAVPQYDNGLYVALVKDFGDSMTVMWHECVSERVLGTNSWGILRIQGIQWVPFADSDSSTLMLEVDQGSVGAGAVHGDRREAYWLRDSDRFWYLGQIMISNYGGSGTFHRSGKSTDRRFEDVDGDGLQDLLIRRQFGYGTGPNTDTGDKGWIALKPAGTAGRFDGGLRAFRYVLEPSGKHYSIGSVPRLVFPTWSASGFAAETRPDSFYVNELDGMAFGDQTVKTLPWKSWHSTDLSGPEPWSGEGGVVVIPSLADDKLICRASLKDSNSSPQYDVVFWVRPITGSDLIRFDYGDTLYAMLVVPNSAANQIDVIQTRIIGDDSVGVMDTLGHTTEYLSRRGGNLSFVVKIPAELTSLSEDSTDFGICHFGVEVIPKGTFGHWQRHGDPPVSQSEPRFSRFYTMSWGTLAEGRRIDTPVKNR